MTETYIGARCLACGRYHRDGSTHECITCRQRAKLKALKVQPDDPRTFTAYGVFELSSAKGTPVVTFDAETENVDIRVRA